MTKGYVWIIGIIFSAIMMVLMIIGVSVTKHYVTDVSLFTRELYLMQHGSELLKRSTDSYVSMNSRIAAYNILAGGSIWNDALDKTYFKTALENQIKENYIKRDFDRSANMKKINDRDITWSDAELQITENENSFTISGKKSFKLSNANEVANPKIIISEDGNFNEEIPSLYFELIDIGLMSFTEEYKQIIHPAISDDKIDEVFIASKDLLSVDLAQKILEEHQLEEYQLPTDGAYIEDDTIKIPVTNTEYVDASMCTDFLQTNLPGKVAGVSFIVSFENTNIPEQSIVTVKVINNINVIISNLQNKFEEDYADSPQYKFLIEKSDYNNEYIVITVKAECAENYCLVPSNSNKITISGKEIPYTYIQLKYKVKL